MGHGTVPSAELAGRLQVEVVLAEGVVSRIRITSTRPRAAPLLLGRSPESALALLPRVFSLCGKAQAAVGAAALHAAGADLPGALPDDWGLRREWVQELVWRLLVDWPKLLGLTPQGGAFVRWYRRLADVPLADAGALADELARFLDESVFGENAPAWSTRATGAAYADALLAAVRALQGPAASVRCLSPRPAAEWARQLRTLPDGFARAPREGGWPAETGALARHPNSPRVAALLRQGETLAARLAARLHELAVAPAFLRQAPAAIEAAVVRPGVGLAVAETARGLLLHRVELRDDRLVDYAVIAPTEWNFPADDSPLSTLMGTPAALAEARVRALMLALDPCIPYSVYFPENSEDSHA